MPLAGRLFSEGPHPDHERELMLFGRFVGSWDVEGEMISPDGTRETHRGEWHFGWALQGRAIQDVLISPPLSELGDESPFEYGTTLRIYDPADATWRVTYVTPIGGVVHTLTGGGSGEDIVLTGTSSRGETARWSFTRILEDSFLWRGEVSGDGGRTWVTNEELRVTRAAA